MKETILIIDFGSQYTQLIARRIRELNVYCEIHPYHNISEVENTKGVILSGSPYSIHDKEAPQFDISKWLKYPLLGICFGGQLLAHKFGGNVEKAVTREYGRTHIESLDNTNTLFDGVSVDTQVWMSHADSIVSLGVKMKSLAHTKNVPCIAFQIQNEDVYGIQFHPEVTHSLEGKKILSNFLRHICHCESDWTPAHFIDNSVTQIQKKVVKNKVILGLSGGVDSSVVASLLHKAIGKQLTCIFIDNGLLRKNEFDQVLDSYKDLHLNVIGIEASEEFYVALKGIIDPEEKRKIIGQVFVRIFEKEAKKIQGVHWLAQGTIYPDVIESCSVQGPSATIKSHHNVGGLPEKMNLKIIEPLRLLFKDEVRRVGKSLELPHHILERHPFPGPGLGIRILGEVTKENVEILQEVDHLFITSLKEEGFYNDVWQALAVLLPVQSVGVMGDERTYEQAVALRAVSSVDGMTADFSHLPHDFLGRVANKIINKVKGINRVVYDISSKPPATIEWE